MRGKLKLLFAFLLAVAMAALLLFSASCNDKQEAATEPGLPEATVDKLDRLVSLMMEQNGIPGIIAGVWVEGVGSWETAAGISDIATGAPEETGLRFRIGSITKTFVTTVVLQLVDEGRLSLDDKLDQYVQGFEYGGEITLRQLCNNTSGVFDYGEAPGFIEANISQPQRRWTTEELVELAKSGAPYFPPGTQWMYCNSNFLLQGVIIEQVTGKGLDEEIDARIARPLGLTSTFLPRGDELGGPHSHGYVEWKGRWGKTEPVGLDDVTYWNPSHGWAAGGMVSNMRDLHVWAKALATGELVSEEMQEERLTWTDVPGAESIQMKYGLGIMSLAGMIGHDGMIWGYNSSMLYYPEEDATIVVFFNRGMDQLEDGTWVTFDLSYVMAAGAILFPGQFPWDPEAEGTE